MQATSTDTHMQVELAVKLGLPLLAPHPSIARHFSLKTGAKQLFKAAKVHVPPGAELQPRPSASMHPLGEPGLHASQYSRHGHA